jgi:hypothetical protein
LLLTRRHKIWLNLTLSETVACVATSSRVSRWSISQRDPGVYLEDIEYYSDAAMRFIATDNLEQFFADEKTRAHGAAGRLRFAAAPRSEPREPAVGE